MVTTSPILASLLYEFHPGAFFYSTAVELTMHRLILFYQSARCKRKDVQDFIEKHATFMGLKSDQPASKEVEY